MLRTVRYTTFEFAMAIFVTAAVAAIGGAVWSKSPDLVSWVGAVGSAMAGTAITVTALLAFQAIKENRFFEIAKLTIGQMEAKHVYDAVDSLRPFYETYNRDLDVARSEAIRLAALMPTPGSQTAINETIISTYTYLAALYSEGMLNRKILLSKDAATIVIMYYIFETLIRDRVAVGMYDPTVSELARDANARVQQNAAIFVWLPKLRGYKVEPLTPTK